MCMVLRFADVLSRPSRLKNLDRSPSRGPEAQVEHVEREEIGTGPVIGLHGHGSVQVRDRGPAMW